MQNAYKKTRYSEAARLTHFRIAYHKGWLENPPYALYGICHARNCAQWPDAFTNPEHIKFGLKGCFAASLCYLFCNAKAWPEINTAITTCFLTALSTIGSSHQKQVVRISGSLVGAVVMGIAAQVFILPYLDSIAGFTLVFVAATIVAAWCAASSPRFSYFGVQIAIAFYLVNLTEFSVQTSLLYRREIVSSGFCLDCLRCGSYSIICRVYLRLWK